MNYTSLSMNIILVFVIAMFASMVPDYLHGFFGDWLCNGAYKDYSNGDGWRLAGCMDGTGPHAPEWHWGWRHWLWMLMSICLFIVQLVRIVKPLVEDK